MTTIFADLRTILARTLRADPSVISPGSSIRRLSNADGTALLAATLAVEDHFGVELPDALLFRVETLEEVTAAIERLRRRGAEAHEPLYDEMEYYRLFDRHEKMRWHLNRDIPWGNLRPEAVSRGERDAIRAVMLAELTSTMASHNFLREFVDDSDFSCWVSVWFYEEVKHFYTLRRWLYLLGADVPNDCAERRVRPDPTGTSRAATCAMTVIAELRLARWYKDMSRLTQEPVLGAILRHLAADESRHAVAFAAFGKRYIDADRGANLVAVLETAYSWLSDPETFKLPLGLFYPAAAGEFRLDTTPTAFKGLARANPKIFDALSEMTGLELRSGQDIKRAVRPLLVASPMMQA